MSLLDDDGLEPDENPLDLSFLRSRKRHGTYPVWTEVCDEVCDPEPKVRFSDRHKGERMTAETGVVYVWDRWSIGSTGRRKRPHRSPDGSESSYTPKLLNQHRNKEKW